MVTYSEKYPKYHIAHDNHNQSPQTVTIMFKMVQTFLIWVICQFLIVITIMWDICITTNRFSIVWDKNWQGGWIDCNQGQDIHVEDGIIKQGFTVKGKYENSVVDYYHYIVVIERIINSDVGACWDKEEN